MGVSHTVRAGRASPAGGKVLGPSFNKHYLNISTSQALFWAPRTGRWTRLTRFLNNSCSGWLGELGELINKMGSEQRAELGV